MSHPSEHPNPVQLLYVNEKYLVMQSQSAKDVLRLGSVHRFVWIPR